MIHVAVNKCRDELRRRARRQGLVYAMDEADADALLSQEPAPEAVALSAEWWRVVERALVQLPWSQRVALVLGDVEGWSYREIADTCGVSLGTVKSRIFRGRVRLRELLA